MLKKVRERVQQLLERLSYRHLLIIAGLTSCLLGVLVYFSLGSDESKQPVEVKPPQKMVQVVAARQDIAPRATIREAMLQMIELPENAVPPGAIRDMKDAINYPAAVIIQQGDILTKKKVMSDPKLAGFVGTIPRDCRAVSVAISDVTGVAGFAQAGDYVDVMIVTGRKEDGRLVGELLMQNVLLLGINKAGAQGSNEAKDSDGNVKATREAMATATLAVKPDEALRLATSAQGGTIYLMLRPYKPKEQIVLANDYVVHTKINQGGDNNNRTPQRTGNATPQPQYQPAPQPDSGSSGGSVEVIRGTTMTREGGSR